MEDKRLEQKKDSWIKNVMKVQNLSKEEAEQLYLKIDPFKITMTVNKYGRTEIREGDQIIGEQG